MMKVYIGGSGSGKSKQAEDWLVKMEEDTAAPRYYIATMKIWDEESQKRVLRHQNMRKEKGFLTIESPVALQRIQVGENNGMLLECMSNLVANEMFASDTYDIETVEKTIKQGICHLMKQTRLLVIVTNNVFDDGILYDQATRDYQRVLGRLNQWLAAQAEYVSEVVFDIEIPWKGAGINETIVQ